MIRFSKLGIPGYHCLWRFFPKASTRFESFSTPYADWWQHLLIQADDSITRTVSLGYLLLTTPTLYSSVNLSICRLADGNKLGLDCFSFARHYSRNRWLLSIPRPTKMFQFRHLPPISLWIQLMVMRHYSHRVSPFGNLRFKGCWHLPEAYRSLLRPSSVTYVKASVICAYVAFYVTVFIRK